VSLDPPVTRRVPLAARLPRLPVKAMLAIIGLAVLLLGGWLWLRDSSLVAVRDVEVTGAGSSEEPRIRSALEEAGLDQTTLHVRKGALRDAVSGYASVAGLRVSTDFPHTMRIEVVEHKPVAVLEIGDEKVPATGSGLLLRGVAADGDLPTIRMDAAPTGEHVTNANARTALRIAASAPARLRARVLRLWTGPKGMMLTLADGPDLIFGDAVDARRKWLAAARVLAAPEAAGATYLDLRIPERVAAGGLAPVTTATPTPAPGTAVVPNPQP
jgi:cell division protein FtsQ